MRRGDNHWVFWDLSHNPARQVLDVETDSYAEPINRLHIEDGIDVNCATAPNSPRVALALPNGGFGIYNLLTESLERKFQSPERLQAVAFDSSGTRLAVGDPNRNEILIFDSMTGAQTATVRCSEAPASLAWNPSGQELACGGYQGELSFWNPVNGESIDTITVTRSVIIQLIYSPEGNYLLSATTDNNIRLWDVASRYLSCRLRNWGFIPAMRLSESGAQLGVSSTGSSAGIVDINLRPVWQILHYPKKKEQSASANWLDFNQDGSLLAVASGGTRLYDVRNGRLIATLSHTSPNLEFVRFTPQDKGERLLVSGKHSGLSSWPIKKLRSSEVEIGPPTLLDSTPGYCMMGADRLGTRIALGNPKQNEIRIWRQESQQSPMLIKERSPVLNAAVSPDGRWLVSTVGDESLPPGPSRSARVWDLASGEIVKEFEGNVGFSGVGRFSDDGKWLAIVGESNQVVSASTWQTGPSIPNDLIEISFSHSGRLMAGAFGQQLTIYSLPQTTELLTINAPYDFSGEFYLIAFSPDDTKLAILSYDGAVHLLDILGLRAGLRAIGLDWEPAGPKSVPSERVMTPLKIHVTEK